MIKIFLNLSSFSWAIFLYILDKNIFDLLSIDFLLCILIFVAINLLPILIFMRCSIYTRVKQKIDKIYPAYTEYIPSFFATCVVAFSLKDYCQYNTVYFILIVCILFWLFYINNVGYLNPTLYLFGYRVYKIETGRINCIIIMHKKIEYKQMTHLENTNLVSLDEHTHIIPNK